MKHNIILTVLMLLCIASQSWGENHVLSLDGDWDYVSIPDAPALRGGKSVVKTIEAWFMFMKGGTVVGKRPKGDASYSDWSISVGGKGETRFYSEIGGSDYRPSSPSGLAAMNQWYHLAAVINRPERLMRLYLNGVLVAEDTNMGNESAATEAPVKIGTVGYSWGFLRGYIDEVRIWNVARTEEQIQDTMFRTLRGDEPGLVAYWQFEGEGEKVSDSTKNGHHGEMVGDAKRVAMELPDSAQRVPKPALLSGVVTDERDKPISNASVRLEQDSLEIALAKTDAEGRYYMSIYPVLGQFDLSATEGKYGDWRLGIRLREGRQTLNLTLKEAISIEGTLLMLDDKTPHAAVPVQAIMVSRGEPVSRPIITTLSDEGGQYQFINLKPGRYQVRCQVLGGYVYYRTTDHVSRFTLYDSQATGRDTGETLHVEYDETLRNINFRFAPFKRGTWKNYDTIDGLGYNAVKDIYRDPDGVMWFATEGGGVSRYDGKEFVNLTTKDGLAHNFVYTIHRDPDGAMWFGTSGGVSRYDGKEFTNFTSNDGLPNSDVHAIHRDPDGVMWFGTGGGVSRYDGKEFVNLTTKDGLVNDRVNVIHRDPNGVLWFGTGWPTPGGVSRYDGNEFVNFTYEHALPGRYVSAIYRDPDGVMWFGTGGGVSRYDGKEFVNLTVKDGLANNSVHAIDRDPNGVMWFGTVGGVSRYDGKTFVNFTTRDGLASNFVPCIHRDPDGVMWFGTGDTNSYERGGVSRYDGEGLINLTTKDGLVHNEVRAIDDDPDGVIWIGTRDGVSRYDGKEFINFTEKDRLVGNLVYAVHGGSDGMMWFGTFGGVSRYDGSEFVNLTTKDGLVNDIVLTIHSDPDGVMWFGTYNGISRYDGKEFVNLTIKDGLVHNTVIAIHSDPDGAMWFGTWGGWGRGGISRYDGEKFVNFTREDGLADNTVWSIHRDPDGVMWFATWGGGVSRYDARGMGDFPHFVNLTTEDGLAHNNVWSIHRDPDGGMWFGTDGGGVSYYDGVAWTSLDTRDGLSGNSVLSIYQDSEGFLWFGTEGGLTRYRRSTVPPKARIASVTTDQTYRDLSDIPAFAIGTRVTIEYDSVDFKTVPEKRQYRCRIYETRDMRHQTSDLRSSSLKSQVSSLTYNPPTKETSFDWIPKKSGTYVFEVQAIDRDLNYSEPASLEVTILPPPFYTRAGFIGGSIFAALLIPSVIYAALLARHKRQELFEPIPNPYMAGGPVRSEEMFFGREDDFRFVSNRLKTEKEGIVIVFYGQRRSGKTSLLHQILNGRLGEGFMPVMIDMQEMAVDSDGEFYEKIADEVSFGLSEVLDVDSTEYDFRTESANPALVFERFIDDVVEQAASLFRSSDDVGKRHAVPVLLLMFDEYELLEEKMDEGIIRSDTPTFLAGILERHAGISLIFTGSRHIDQRNPQYWRTLLGKSTARRISLLSERDTLRLIREPVADAIRYQKAVPQRIYRLTGGQPFYTQHVCQLLIESLNSLERNRVYADDVEKTALELVDNPPPQMMYFWSEELKAKEKLALVLLGRIIDRSDDYASAGMVAEYAASREEDINLEAPEIAGILDGLCQYELLERERVSEETYEYRYKIDLFRYWVQRHQSIAQVMREMSKV